MHANFPSRQTNINININFCVVVSNVAQEPLAFTTPCSAAIDHFRYIKIQLGSEV